MPTGPGTRPSNSAVSSTAPAAPTALSPSTVPEVIAGLDSVQAQAVAADDRGARDGLACFNYLYRSITGEVLQRLEQPDGFQDKRFMAALDVEFAKRYFHAIALYQEGPASAPRSWRVLLDKRADATIAPLQFAVAGVNAHVNFDLAFALVAACQSIGSPLGSDTQRQDYQCLNQIFADQMTSLRHHFEDLVERTLDRSEVNVVNNTVDDLIVVLTRDAAWHRAEHLWSVRDQVAAFRAEEETLDILVGLAGRGLLAHL